MTSGELPFCVAACVLHTAWVALPGLRGPVRASLGPREGFAYLLRWFDSSSSQSQACLRDFTLHPEILDIPEYHVQFLM